MNQNVGYPVMILNKYEAKVFGFSEKEIKMAEKSKTGRIKGIYFLSKKVSSKKIK